MSGLSGIIDQLPKSLLEQLPAAQPPPGQQTDLTAQPQGADEAIKATSVFCALAVIFYVNRAIVKMFIQRKLTWDDLTLTLGLVCSIVGWAWYVVFAKQGVVGKHMWDVPVSDVVLPRYGIGEFTQVFFDPLSLLFIKATFLIQYFQIFWPFKWLRTAVYISAPIICSYYVGVWVAITVLAAPQPGETWSQHEVSNMNLEALKLTVPNACVGLLTDLFLFLLPIRAVFQLQLPTRKRIGVLFVFMTGSLAVVCSIMTLYYRVKLWSTGDYTYWEMNMLLMLSIERFVGTIVVNMPAVAKMMKVVRPKVESLGSSLRSKLLSTKGSNETDATGTSRSSESKRHLTKDSRKGSDAEKKGSSGRGQLWTVKTASYGGPALMPKGTHANEIDLEAAHGSPSMSDSWPLKEEQRVHSSDEESTAYTFYRSSSGEEK